MASKIHEVTEKVVAAGFSLRYIAQPKGCGYHIWTNHRLFQQSLHECNECKKEVA